MKENAWQSKPQVVKGNVGEVIVREYLEREGYIVYEPVTNEAHAFDKFAVKNKNEIMYVECKAKSRRNFYEDTGISIKHYDEYTRLCYEHNFNIFIFFIDEMLGLVYGNNLDKLVEPVMVMGKQYPSIEKNIIYFPLANMITISTLDAKDVNKLKGLSTRTYGYRM